MVPAQASLNGYGEGQMQQSLVLASMPSNVVHGTV